MKFMEKLKEMSDFDRVKFVILYGSRVSGNSNNMSDYDFAIYYEGNKKERFEFRLKLSSDSLFDVQIFQDLPLYVRKDVLKGKLIYVKDNGFVYDVAYETIKSFESFKKYYYDYIKMRKIR